MMHMLRSFHFSLLFFFSVVCNEEHFALCTGLAPLHIAIQNVASLYLLGNGKLSLRPGVIPLNKH